jgi:hypothetical protein
MGTAVLLALLLAVLGGWSLQRLRVLNAEALHARVAALAAGSQDGVRALQWGGIARDAVRGLLLTGLGLAGALVLRAFPPVAPRLQGLLAAAAIGCALAAVAGGAARSAGRTRRLSWLLAGLAVGVLATLGLG